MLVIGAAASCDGIAAGQGQAEAAERGGADGERQQDGGQRGPRGSSTP